MMRTAPSLMLGAMAFLAFNLWVLPWSPAHAETLTWKELPAPVFQNCIRLSQRIQPNPRLLVEDDYIVVTAYEERVDEPKVIEENESFVNVYLVSELLVMSDRPVGVLFNSRLIVKKWVHSAESGTETTYEWVLWDRDSDGFIEEALFQSIIKDAQDNSQSIQAVGIPDGDLEEMQLYFKEALHRMDQKMERDLSGTCTPA